MISIDWNEFVQKDPCKTATLPFGLCILDYNGNMHVSSHYFTNECKNININVEISLVSALKAIWLST